MEKNGLEKVGKLFEYLASTNRYFLGTEEEKIWESITTQFESRRKNLKKGDVYFRARICDLSIQAHIENKDGSTTPPQFNLNDMGAPPPLRCQGGRINPKGIPALYLSNIDKTAIAEVGPRIRDVLTVAKFKLTQEVEVVDIRDKLDGNLIWYAIDYLYSLPVVQGDIHNTYACTQYLSEFIKLKGYAGIIYGSAVVQDGYNLALFDTSKATPVECVSHTIQKIEYKTDQDHINEQIPGRKSSV